MADMQQDAHARPPETIRRIFKQWQKSTPQSLSSNSDILDTISLDTDDRVCEHRSSDNHIQDSTSARRTFVARDVSEGAPCEVRCFEVKCLPGLFIYPSLFPADIQMALLNKLLHRDLSNPDHKTNLHLHYHMPEISATTSMFDLDQHFVVQPRDPAVHKPISMAQILEKKLRWVTLGGQYDWTNKVYPDETPPQFPEDIADLLRGTFPSVDPQAAILNFYSPGDTLSLHRDVSEYCDRGLISLSMGSDALFLVADFEGSNPTTIRLRSGDIVLMSDNSRYAWHAIPKVLPDTCPDYLRAWPASSPSPDHEKWRGWLANKRINLNVRQMSDEAYTYNTNSTESFHHEAV